MIDLWVQRAQGGAQNSHSWVRERVAELLGGTPESVPLGVDDDGVLSFTTPGRRLNLSHHRDWFALAVSTGEPVGVDVLTVPDDAEFVTDTALVLSREEVELVRSSPRELRGTAFAGCWVRKEAYAKLRRTGLTAGLSGLTFSPAPARAANVAFWTARIEDAMVSVATTGVRAPEVRLHGCSRPARTS
jgi:4'-phosphopantetheinyl transferase